VAIIFQRDRTNDPFLFFLRKHQNFPLSHDTRTSVLSFPFPLLHLLTLTPFALLHTLFTFHSHPSNSYTLIFPPSPLPHPLFLPRRQAPNLLSFPLFQPNYHLACPSSYSHPFVEARVPEQSLQWKWELLKTLRLTRLPNQAP